MKLLTAGGGVHYGVRSRRKNIERNAMIETWRRRWKKAPPSRATGGWESIRWARCISRRAFSVAQIAAAQQSGFLDLVNLGGQRQVVGVVSRADDNCVRDE
ncbi:hypothetical protein Zmor_028191 [Zophobas morio]|uniref:Uncharacterized protein n=1 Tax=Zophobas morio TaxID=2755281 RepID=A0AA38M3S4_9CUCU|nr:hypothetical protein Zmor_028191 [Zophobas morio]